MFVGAYIFKRVSVSSLCHLVSRSIALPGMITEAFMLLPTAASLWLITKATPRAFGLVGSGEGNIDIWVKKSFS